MQKMFYLIILVLFSAFTTSISQWNQVFKMNGTMMQWDFDCADSLNCISVGNNVFGMVNVRTTDGGYNWFVQFADTQKTVYNDQGQVVDVIPTKFKGSRCIDFVTPDFIVVGHREGQISISKDGGLNWDSVQLSTSRDLKKVKFIDENYGVAFGGFKSLFKTYNGGQDWEEFKINYYGSELENYGTTEINIDLLGKDSLIVVIYNYRDTSHKFYTIYRTFDGGQNWDMGTKIPRYSDYKPYFINMEDGWLSGRIGAGNQKYYDVIYYTSDGGQTWESQLDTLVYPERGLSGVYFLNSNAGIAWGDGRKIWRTNDGGKNWNREEVIIEDINDSFQQMVFPNKNFTKRIANTYLAGSIWLYEDLTSANENVINFDNLNIYPNPTSDFITIQFQTSEVLQTSEVSKVLIFDMLGIEVLSESIHPMTGSHRMNVEKLPTGVYFIRIGTRVEKFVKM